MCHVAPAVKPQSAFSPTAAFARRLSPYCLFQSDEIAFRLFWGQRKHERCSRRRVLICSRLTGVKCNVTNKEEDLKDGKNTCVYCLQTAVCVCVSVYLDVVASVYLKKTCRKVLVGFLASSAATPFSFQNSVGVV